MGPQLASRTCLMSRQLQRAAIVAALSCPTRCSVASAVQGGARRHGVLLKSRIGLASMYNKAFKRKAL